MEAVAGEVGKDIAEGVMAWFKHHYSYLSHYHENIENLSSKVAALEARRLRVDEQVREAARNCQKNLYDDVKDWLAKVEGIKKEIEGILKDKDKVGNGCWKGLCLSLKLRYRLSRKAMKEACKLDLLLAVGEFETVAPPRLPLGVVYDPTPIFEIEQATSDAVLAEVGHGLETVAHTQHLSGVGYEPTAQHLSEVIASSSASTRGGLESRLSILENIMEAVKDDQFRIVRICGMGGIGKTTMAEEVKKISAEKYLFNDIPMVEINTNPDVGLIQGYLADSLGLKFEEGDVKARAVRIRDRLNDENRRILVILDNVWEEEDLEDVGIPLRGENSRCKILLTSRQDNVCKKIAPEKVFKIEVLSPPEASILFRQSLGDVPCYEEIAEELVKVCAGLPIAIKTIARAVANKDKNSWMVAVEELQKFALEVECPAVYNCLNVSYGFLKNVEIKKFFRLCCLFPKGFDIPIEDLARYGMALRLFGDINDKLYKARNKAHRNVETLLHSNLLLRGDLKESVKIHDLVWDFSVSTSSNGLFMVNYDERLEEWPRSDSYKDYTSISLLCSEMNKVPEGLNCQNLELLQLSGDWGTKSLEFPENFYEGMGGLNVLAFRNLKVPLTPKLLQPLSNLRTLSLYECSLRDDVCMIGNLDKLEVLSFAHSAIEELPTEIGQLTGLRLLDLTWCKQLCTIARGVFSSFICLEELYMRGTKWWFGNESQATFTEIASLPKLGVIDIQMPQKFLLPKDSLFAKLKKFKISVRKYGRSEDGDLFFEDVYLFEDEYLSENEYRFENSLDLQCDSSVLLQNRIKLLLRETERMDLTVMGLNTLLDDSKTLELPNMKCLSLKSCNELVHLVNTVGNLHQNNAFLLLESLYLIDLESLEDICHFHNSSESIVELSGRHSTQLVLEPFSNLKVLHVGGCHKLEYIFTLSAARGLMMLERIKIHQCEKLKVIFWKERGDEDENVTVRKIEFRSLKYLSLEGLPNLVRFCNARDAIEFPHLVDLKLCRLPLLTSIYPETGTSASGLNHASSSHPFFNQKIALTTSLEDMKNRGTNSMELWRDHFAGGFSYGLRNMTVGWCSKLLVLFPPHLIQGFSNLEKLEIKCCANLEVVFDLEELTIVGGKHKLVMLNRLAEIKVEGCHSLRYLFSPLIAKCLVKLRRLSIIRCNLMEEIVSKSWDEEGEVHENSVDMIFFPELHELVLMDLPKLICFGPVGANAFDKLSFGAHDQDNANSSISTPIFNGKVAGCDNLLSLFPPHMVVRLPVLQHLFIKQCDSLRYVFSSSMVTSLVELRRLEIIECKMMEVIVKDEENEEAADKMSKLVFPRLTSLTIKGLPNLGRICLGLHDFDWSSLTSVDIKFCRKMGIFTYGYSSMPILDSVLINLQRHIMEEGDLNTILMSLQQKGLDNLSFREEGILTINGFLIAGEHLVAQCPSWSWESGHSFMQNNDLPSKRQFLITKNVPCLRRARARASSSTVVAVEDKNEADHNECADENNIPRPRTYDVSITYDIHNQTPRLWLRGYDESKTILPLELVLQDIAEVHPQELVTIQDHPHMGWGWYYGKNQDVSLYPCLQPSVIKDFSDQLTKQGLQPHVRQYLQLLLEFYAPHIPTIQYSFR